MFLDFYRLREQPFGVTPDPAYLYASRTHCEALDSLTEAILGDRGFLALIAEPGMGKTTLLYQVLDGLRETARAVFLFQTQCNSREFFQYLMSELGVDTTGMGLVAMHNKLNEILFAEMLAGRRFVLIVDEAQNLDDSVLETIRMLSNFETPHAKLMQIVLAGQAQLWEKLEQRHLAQLLQRITVMKHLEALSTEETAGYIRHRLKVAGYCGEELFESEAVALVAERSQGVPRNINKICFRALLEAYGRGQLTVSAEIVEKATQRVEVVVAPRLAMAAGASVSVASSVVPINVAGATPAAAPTEVESQEIVSRYATPQLTYQPLTLLGLPRRGMWTGAIVVALLSGGLVLPRNVMNQVTQIMRKEVKATESLVRREAADLQKQTMAVQEATLARLANETRTGEQGMPSVTGIQTSSSVNDAQVVVLLDNAVQYESARLSGPDRIYFDLHKARLGPAVGPKTVSTEDGLLKWVRAAQNSDEVVRLVLDANGAKDFSAKLLSDPYRLVIDVHAHPMVAEKSAVSSDTATPLKAAYKMPETTASHAGQFSLTRELGLKINRIAIDAGHGGYDTGTAGPRGLLEKNLCLDVALRLGQLIEENIPGAQVIYTRKDDRHVPLEERTAIANDANADLFISIHANSSDSREIRGVETYYVSLATSQEARDVATRENSLAESSIHNLPDLVKKITRNEKTAESKQLAADIQNALSQRLQLVSRQETNRGVKQAPFIVLTGAKMPAVLSEISFVSNASDENLLFEGGQRQRVAEGLYRGIAAYLDTMHSRPQAKQKLVSVNRSATSTGIMPASGADAPRK